MRKFLIVSLLLTVLVTSLSAAPAKQTQVVNVYSARTYGAMEQAFVNFTEETGIEVRVSQGSVQALIERLRAEGDQTPADVFFSIDAGTLDLAAEEGLLQPVESEVLAAAVPEDLRDPENRWFGISQRIRTIMYNPETVDPSELSTYEDLAHPKWNGRLCLRPATHIYTISLTASLVAAYGEEAAQEIVQGWVDNNPQYIDSDTEILNTVAAGGCDVALTNHYYLARLKNEDPEFPVEIFWANQGEEERGVFRNISGAGVTASAVNYENAVKLIEWMATTGQAADETGIPGGNFEFPVAEDAEINEVIAGFGDFSELIIDPLPLSEYGDYQAAAVTVLENAGYGF
jgi:iron(III) transport system substrate-binding protein